MQAILKAVFSVSALFFSFGAGAQLVINTFAGTGAAAYGGDGSAATAAGVNNPYGVAVDHAGNVYVADYGNNRIRKINTAGIISTIAGTGTAGFSGDNGPATIAEIYAPRGIATDAAGNVYFSDYANNRIRKINTAGIISTIAGTGAVGYAGDNGPATSAELNFAWGIAVDATGNVIIADQINCRVRRINTSGIISLVGGTGIAFFGGDGGQATAAGIQYPMGVAVDGGGNIYVADDGDNRIRKINPAGIISTIAGSPVYGFTGDGGPSTLARLYYPQGVATDAAGNIYIADLNNNRIRKINTSGIINTIAGDGTAGFSGDGGSPVTAAINQSTGVAVDLAGNVYISDNDNNRIRIIHNLSHAPYFIGGHNQSITLCPTEFFSIDSLLAVYDASAGLTETWSVISPALHGTLTAAYTTTSTGGILTPTGLTYLPAAGYTGNDSFKVRVNDGSLSDTTTIYVTILSLPSAGTITGTDSLCPGDTLSLADTATGGAWSSSNTSLAMVTAAGLITGLAPGTCNIIYTVTNICGTATAFFPFLLNTDCINRVSSVSVNAEISISPNPGAGTLTVRLNANTNEDVHFIITNITGQMVKNIMARTNTSVDIRLDSPPGVYFLTAITAYGKYAGKIVVEN